MIVAGLQANFAEWVPIFEMSEVYTADYVCM